MKHKLILIMAVIIGYSSLAFANFEKNFKKSIKEKVDIDVEIQLKKPLRSFDGQYFVIGRTANGNIFPVIVSTDGKHFVGLSSVMNFSKEDSKMIMDEINKAGEEKMKSDREALLKLFAEFKDYDFIALEGKTKNLPTKIVVTDPDCPYCRKHLEEIEKDLFMKRKLSLRLN